MTDKHCLSCMRNAHQDLFCKYCEKKGFLKSGLLGFLFFDALFLSQIQHITYEDPDFLKAFLALSTVSIIIAYSFRQLISAVLRSVILPVFSLLILLETLFQTNQHFMKFNWLDSGHSYYWSALPLIAFFMTMLRTKPILINGLRFQQQDYESGSKMEAEHKAKARKRQKLLTEEHKEIEDQEILGL